MPTGYHVAASKSQLLAIILIFVILQIFTWSPQIHTKMFYVIDPA